MTTSNNNKLDDEEDSLPIPNKIITYPIGDDPIGGALYLYGNINASNIAICCAGYPDDHTCFQPFADQLAKRANCFVGVTCLPGYDDRDDHPYTVNKNDGYTFEEWTDAMQTAIKILRDISTNPNAKLTGIFHDWGVVAGMTYTNRSLRENEINKTNNSNKYCPNQVVIFDVLGPPHPDTPNKPITVKPTIYEIVVEISYRIILATSFALRKYISKYFAQLYFIPNMIGLSILRLQPSKDVDTKLVRKKSISLDRMIYMAYPYYNLMKTILTNTVKDVFIDLCLPKNLQKTPILYMYGLEKRIHFHDKCSIQILQREQEKQEKQKQKDKKKNHQHRSKVIAVENAGHWLYIQQFELCLKEVIQFVQDA